MSYEWFEKRYNEIKYPNPNQSMYRLYSVYKDGEVLAKKLSFSQLRQVPSIAPEIQRDVEYSEEDYILLLKSLDYLIEETFDRERYESAIQCFEQTREDLIESMKKSLFYEYLLRSSPRTEFIWERCWEEFGDSNDIDVVVKTFKKWVGILFLPNE